MSSDLDRITRARLPLIDTTYPPTGLPEDLSSQFASCQYPDEPRPDNDVCAITERRCGSVPRAAGSEDGQVLRVERLGATSGRRWVLVPNGALGQGPGAEGLAHPDGADGAGVRTLDGGSRGRGCPCRDAGDEDDAPGVAAPQAERTAVLLAAANSRAEMLHDSIEDFLQHGRRPLLRDALDAYREDMEAAR